CKQYSLDTAPVVSIRPFRSRIDTGLQTRASQTRPTVSDRRRACYNLFMDKRELDVFILFEQIQIVIRIDDIVYITLKSERQRLPVNTGPERKSFYHLIQYIIIFYVFIVIEKVR
ncbi:hypothetical protein, partial [Stenotrophomonas maltophilia group sp. RNC7]|uniref:hypothetical protein n=1 Tax=Stenotrophomonas maltophilia group sp. RNC7 TaxID=3071467 RepID=UPI0027E18E44